MWLDRLPTKRDVVRQYIYTRETLPGNPEAMLMTANAVKYIWDEAAAPCVDLKEIDTTMKQLFNEVCSKATDHNQENQSPVAAINVYAVFLECNSKRKTDSLLSRVLESASMYQLFDVSLKEEVQQNNSFYHDQKNERKLRNEKRLGQMSMRGDDVYYAHLRGTSAVLTGSYYDFQPDLLPTKLDVLKYCHSRTNLRYVRNSGEISFLIA